MWDHFTAETKMYLYVFKPVCRLETGKPMRFLHIGVDDIFEFLQRFPHDVDILNV